MSELEPRFGYSLDELARRFDRSISWVTRRLALVELLPEAIQRQVREGHLTAQMALKFSPSPPSPLFLLYLVPVARIGADDCERVTAYGQATASGQFGSRPKYHGK